MPEHSAAPGPPLTSAAAFSGVFGRSFGAPAAGLGQQARFTSPGAPNTTGLVFSQPPTMSVPSAGLPKGLNPNAPDFNRSGMYNQLRGGGPRQGMPPPPQQKMPGGFGYNSFGMGGNSFQPQPPQQQQANSQNILINQGINAYLSSLNLGGGLGPAPALPGDMGMSGLAGLAEMSLGGRTLSELQDMLGPEAVPGYNPSSMDSISGEMSGMSIGSSLGSLRSAGPIGRPIGAERQRLGPSPLGAGMGPHAGSKRTWSKTLTFSPDGTSYWSSAAQASQAASNAHPTHLPTDAVHAGWVVAGHCLRPKHVLELGQR